MQIIIHREIRLFICGLVYEKRPKKARRTSLCCLGKEETIRYATFVDIVTLVTLFPKGGNMEMIGLLFMCLFMMKGAADMLTEFLNNHK